MENTVPVGSCRNCTRCAVAWQLHAVQDINQTSHGDEELIKINQEKRENIQR